MKLQVEVEYADGERETVLIGPVTQVAFEREHGCGIGILATDQRLTYMYWLAWHAVTRGTKPFDEWLDQIAGVENASKGEGVAPFDEAASDGG